MKKKISLPALSLIIIFGMVITFFFISYITGMSIKEILSINEVLASVLIAVPVFVTWFINRSNEEKSAHAQDLETLFRLIEELSKSFDKIINDLENKNKSIVGVSEDIKVLINARKEFERVYPEKILKFPLNSESLIHSISKRFKDENDVNNDFRDLGIKDESTKYLGAVITEIMISAEKDFLEKKTYKTHCITLLEKLPFFSNIDFDRVNIFDLSGCDLTHTDEESFRQKIDEAIAGKKFYDCKVDIKKILEQRYTIEHSLIDKDVFENCEFVYEGKTKDEIDNILLQKFSKNVSGDRIDTDEKIAQGKVFDLREKKFGLSSFLVSNDVFSFDLGNVDTRAVAKSKIIENLNKSEFLNCNRIDTKNAIVAISRDYSKDESNTDHSIECVGWHSISQAATLQESNNSFYVFAIKVEADGKNLYKCLVFEAERFREYLKVAQKTVSKASKYNFYFTIYK